MWPRFSKMRTGCWRPVAIAMLRVHTAKRSVGSACYAPLSVAKLLDLDPNSYVNYYKRATAYLSLGRHAQAIEDFDSILRINPSFTQVCGSFCKITRDANVNHRLIFKKPRFRRRKVFSMMQSNRLKHSQSRANLTLKPTSWFVLHLSL